MPKDDEKEWDPSKELEDKEEEEEVASVARRRARLNFLTEQETAKLTKKKRKGGVFDL